MTRTTILRLLKLASVSVFAIIIVAYAASRSLDYIRGPKINITHPTDWAVSHSAATTISGQVERVTDISLNGKPIFIDQQGNFSEIRLLFPGMNFIKVKAKDRFDRETEKVVRVYYDNDGIISN